VNVICWKNMIACWDVNLDWYLDRYLVDDIQYIKEIRKVSPLCLIHTYYCVLNVKCKLALKFTLQKKVHVILIIISTLIVVALLCYIQIVFKLEVWKLILGLHTPTHSHNTTKYNQYENHIVNFVVASPLHISSLHFFTSYFLHLYPLVCILWSFHILHSRYLIFLSLFHCCLNFAPSPLCIFTIFFIFVLTSNKIFMKTCHLLFISLFHHYLHFEVFSSQKFRMDEKQLDRIVIISCVTFLLKILGQNTIGIPKRIVSFCSQWTPSLKTCRCNLMAHSY
jgi:hypothetical protein